MINRLLNSRRSYQLIYYHVHVAKDSQKIHSFEWPTWRALLHYIICRLLFDQTSFQVVRQTGCQYVNCIRSKYSVALWPGDDIPCLPQWCTNLCPQGSRSMLAWLSKHRVHESSGTVTFRISSSRWCLGDTGKQLVNQE